MYFIYLFILSFHLANKKAIVRLYLDFFLRIARKSQNCEIKTQNCESKWPLAIYLFHGNLQFVFR